MNRYDRRSAMNELIDAPGIPFGDWAGCLRELNIINTWLGGHRITRQGLQSLLSNRASGLTVAEIGCGGGDNLKAIHAWNRTRGLPIRYIGIDLNRACIDFARENCRDLPAARFIHADYRAVSFKEQPDIIFSSLFCHHFTDEQLVEMLKWLKQNARTGFFINDLQRHPLAYHSIRLLTRFFSGSYLVRNDAPISVLRGFRRSEWEALLQGAGIGPYRITWKWAFRYLITVPNLQ
ncbi:MAG TPA: methyltransferase domain-containing protein [Anseongella sp.]|nr:methyltransferase domain-containing protein [Anseongella sp.]